MHAHDCDSARDDRRQFLKQAGTLSVSMVAAGCASLAAAGEAPAEGKLPMIRLGQHDVSRLVCGANPFNGGSHLSQFVNRQMKEYYTPEQILKTLRRCYAMGVNTWQAHGKNYELYRQLREEGLQMNYLSIEGYTSQNLPDLAKAGCIGAAHHGEVTDKMFKTGRLDEIADFFKRVHDLGMLAGVSTHMPAVVEAIESKSWEVDYYMTCVYERHRSAEDLQKLLGYTPLPVGEVYLAEDPPRMLRMVRQTKRPCLAFKILAAGRLSERKEWVEKAFRDTFAAIKPTDGVIVGIYDRYSDQPAEDAALVRKFG